MNQQKSKRNSKIKQNTQKTHQIFPHWSRWIKGKKNKIIINRKEQTNVTENG